MIGPVHSCPEGNECPRTPFLCPLSCVIAGTAVRIKQVAASPEMARRLRELGLCEEQDIRLLSHHPNLICLVCNARLAISSQLAETIIVETLPAATQVG